MEIKPPGSGKPNLNPVDENLKVTKKSEKSFSVNRPDSLEKASLTEKAQGSRFAGVSAQFSNADLKDTNKVEVVLRSSIQELLQTEFPNAAFPSERDRENFIELMAKDPLFRGKLLGHLEKILK